MYDIFWMWLCNFRKNHQQTIPTAKIFRNLIDIYKKDTNVNVRTATDRNTFNYVFISVFLNLFNRFSKIIKVCLNTKF